MNKRRIVKIAALASTLLLVVVLTVSLLPASHATSGTRILIQDYGTVPPTVYCDITTPYQAAITNNGTQYSIVTSGNPVCHAPVDDRINIIPGQ